MPGNTLSKTRKPAREASPPPPPVTRNPSAEPTREWPALMSDEVVAAYLGVSPRLVWRLASEGKLPKPIGVAGTRCKRWKRDEVDAAVSTWE